MINEVLLVGGGALITWLLAMPSKAAEHRLRQAMYRQINDEQIESHRNTNQSILSMFNNAEHITQAHRDFSQRILLVKEGVFTSISDSTQAAHDASLSAGEVSQNFRKTSLEDEQGVRLSITELEQIIVQLSQQLALANDTIRESLNRKPAYDSEKVTNLEKENQALKEENRIMKNALEQALIDFKIITEVNALLKNRIEELEEKYCKPSNSSSHLTMF